MKRWNPGRTCCAIILFMLSPAMTLGASSSPPSQDTGVPPLITIQKGNLPIVISAPHGGKLQVPGVAGRTPDKSRSIVTSTDLGTEELASQLAEEITRIMPGKPYTVIARYHRRYLDANRPAGDTAGTAEAMPLHLLYHTALSNACREIRVQWGMGLLLDLHGQSAVSNTVFRGTRNGITVTNLIQRHGMAANNGPASILGGFEKMGHQVVPGLGATHREDRRFNGAYIVNAHGSHTAHGLDAIQIEFAMEFRRPENRQRTARDLAVCIRDHCREFFGGNP